jgi:hypothetical protein
VAIYLILFPLVVHGTDGQAIGRPHATFVALFGTFQVFTVDADIGQTISAYASSGDPLAAPEALYAAILCTVAPVLAVGFVLTFFQTFSAYLRFVARRWADLNVLSELNEASIALATSLRQAEPKALIVFTDVFQANTELAADLVDQARGLGATCFKNDILSLPRWRSRRARIRCFIMGSDESENVRHAVGIVTDPWYARRPETDLFVFSDTVLSALALSQRSGRVRVRRTNPARIMVHYWLWRDRTSPAGLDDAAPSGSAVRPSHQPSGLDLFYDAVPDGPDRNISAVIIGLGAAGLEMVKALSWYCQMDYAGGSYRLRINAFDQRRDATARFAADFPGLAEGGHFGPSPRPNSPREDAIYDVRVHGDIDVTSPALTEALSQIDPVTFVFISLGDDLVNLEMAVKLRRWFARQGQRPRIVAVARQAGAITAQLSAVAGTKSGQAEGIDLIGGLTEVYRFETVVQSELEMRGLLSHVSWRSRSLERRSPWTEADIESFWENEYFYTSSLAPPLHWKARRGLPQPGLPGAHKLGADAVGLPGAVPPGSKRSKAEERVIMRLEHARWNAFMRAQGFIWGATKDLVVAKTHPDLVLFSELSVEGQAKDINDYLDVLRNLELWQAELIALPVGNPDKAFLPALTSFISQARRLVSD